MTSYPIGSIHEIFRGPRGLRRTCSFLIGQCDLKWRKFKKVFKPLTTVEKVFHLMTISKYPARDWPRLEAVRTERVTFLLWDSAFNYTTISQHYTDTVSALWQGNRNGDRRLRNAMHWAEWTFLVYFSSQSQENHCKLHLQNSSWLVRCNDGEKSASKAKFIKWEKENLRWPWSDLHVALATLNITEANSRLSLGYKQNCLWLVTGEAVMRDNNRSKGCRKLDWPWNDLYSPSLTFALWKETKRLTGSARCTIPVWIHTSISKTPCEIKLDLTREERTLTNAASGS